MEWVYDDGGRAEAGFKGKTGDCVCRAIAIATEKPYREVYDLINATAKTERTGSRKRGKSSARTGVYTSTIRKVMSQLGWEWHPTMGIGTGCRVHLNADELPNGRLVVNIAKHTVAVIDGVIHDIWDCSDRGCYCDEYGNTITTDRCVYGYYTRR